MQKKQSIYKKIFSIENEGMRKIITLFGVKLKFKLQRLINRTHDYDLENIHYELYKLRREYQYKIHKYCPKEQRCAMLCDWFFEKTGEILNLDNPKTFNEKIQWMKLYDSTPIKTQLADKYLVRDWVKEQIGEEYLIPLLGVWDNFDDIDFDKLPQKFVLKCNHGCKYNIIVKDKNALDIEETKIQVNNWMYEDFAFVNGFQMHYSPIPHKIIAEEYIENNYNDLYDYKFWCFDGRVEYIQFLAERNCGGLKGAFYDRNWVRQEFVSNPYDMTNIKKPDNLDKMIELAQKLSQGFNYVRVDFYRLNNGKIYFGEMTFTPASGRMKWNPEKYNMIMGEKIHINNKR